MKIYPDIILTKDNFDDNYSNWQGISITVMGDELKICRNDVPSAYYHKVAIYEKFGILIGIADSGSMIITKDGRYSERYEEISTILHYDSDKLFAVIKKQYRNVDWHKYVIGMNILDLNTMVCLDDKFTWPIWINVMSIENKAIVIKKADNSYAISTLDTYPATYVISNAFDIQFEDGYTYKVKQAYNSIGYESIDISKKINKKSTRITKHGTK